MSNAEVWPITEIPAGGGPGPTAIVYTASFAPTGDQALLLSGQPLIFNSASAITFTLPSSPPSADWWCWVENIGAGGLTIVRNSHTIDGVAADVALTQHQGVIVFTNGFEYFTVRGLGGGGSGGLSGVNVQTDNYTLLSGDNGKLLVMNASANKSFTLPATPPSTTWAVFFDNIGTGVLTIARNGLTIDGAAADLTLYQDQGLALFTDGTNYFTSRGPTISRGAPSFTTASLAAGAQETGSVNVGRVSLLYKVVVSEKCRVRLYSTAAGRDADVSRAIGTQAEWNVGLLADLVLDLSALLSFVMQPTAILVNMDSTPAIPIYYTVTNMAGASSAFTVTLTRGAMR